jgi:D-alanine-D-alanine ligase
VRIGLTYDLRDEYRRLGYSEDETAEFDAAETIDAIAHALTSVGHQVDRIGGIRSLTSQLAAGARWDLVFNYAEGMFGFGREAQVPALLDAFQIPYTFSDALTMALTLHKAMAKRVVRDAGIPTPAFAVIEDEADIQTLDLPYPVFAKPVAGGSSAGISAACLATAPTALAAVCRDLRHRFRQPVLVEAFLPGREVTVGIIGTGVDATVLGVMEVLFLESAEAHGYSYDNKQRYKEHVRYGLATGDVATQAGKVALAAWRALGCRDGGRVDCRCDAAGQVQFLEVNPIPGLHPVDSDLTILARLLGVPHQQLIERILASAIERLQSEQTS